MAIVFSPANHRDADCGFDLRVTLVTVYNGAKSDECKWMGLDFRASPDVVKQWGIRSGDKIVARVEDDGSFMFTIVLPTEKGYVVRVGGVRGHSGRRGFGYWRFSASPSVARQVIPEGKTQDLEFVGIDGRTAMFTPVAKRSGVEFVPAH